VDTIERLSLQSVRNQDGLHKTLTNYLENENYITIKKVERIPHDAPNPADILLNLEAENLSHQLIRKACNALTVK